VDRTDRYCGKLSSVNVRGVTTPSFGRFCSASRIAACHSPGRIFEAVLEQRLMELAALLVTQRRIPDDFLDVAVFYVKAS
jgi:hypothetical protein